MLWFLTFDTHMNQCAQTFDTHMYQNLQHTVRTGQTDTGDDRKDNFLFKTKQKTFLWHWDIGIRMNLQILNFWRVWENFEVSGKQRFGQHRTMVRRNRKYVQRWSGENVVPGFLWFQPGLTNSNSNILGHLQKNQYKITGHHNTF